MEELLLHSCLYSLMVGFVSIDASEENKSWYNTKLFETAVPLCISISICCSAYGFVYQTRGLKHGRAIVVSTCAAVASIVTGVLAGMLALGERLPSAPMARLSQN
nr:probable magnesium transporter NIPA9 [Ipomoea batatas]